MSGQLAPLVFEIHHDQANDMGRAGLIAENMGDNPVYQALGRSHGMYNPNYGAPTGRGGLGANRNGMAIIELGRSYKNWTPEMITQNTDKLWNSLMSVEAVKSGQRPLHFYVGHGDVVTGQTGAPGEREMNRAVITQLQQRAQKAGLKNFNFYKSHPVVHGNTGGPKDNWTRAAGIHKGKDGGLRWPGSDTVLPAVATADTPSSGDNNTNPTTNTGVDASISPNLGSNSNPGRQQARERVINWAEIDKIENKTPYTEYSNSAENNFSQDYLKDAPDAFDIRERDVNARAGFDPRFD